MFYFLLVWWPLSKCVALITHTHMQKFLLEPEHQGLVVWMIVATDSISQLIGFIFAATIVKLYIDKIESKKV